MDKSTFSKTSNFDEEVIFCLERQMIPAWERYGMDHLAASKKTLPEFCGQSLPDQMQALPKKRKSKKPVKYRQRAGNNSIIESWPEDDQVNVRFPILIYVRSGQAEFQLGDYVAQCPQEHFLFLSPGVPRPAGERPHLEEPRHGKQCEVWWLRSVGHDDHVALSVCYSEGAQHTNSGQYYIVNDPCVVQLFHIFSQEIMGREQHYKKTCFATFQTFLLLFLREIKANRFYNRGENNLPRSASAGASPIEMARQYIDKNLNHPLTIDTVAQAVFMARSNFTRQFCQETGQTFCSYLIERRLEEAKHWLLNESCSIDVVCKFVGLKSSRFHQLFQQRFGMTPGEFRKQHKNS
jgi:AraC-like DNA-binding protein